MARHIGIYSGTFDPIHAGHLAFAKESIKQCGLDEVVFLPEPQPREKNAVSPIADRIHMIRSAISDDSPLSVVQLTSEQFSTDVTLPELQSLFPDASFTLLVGSDVVRTFSYRWKNLEMLLDTVSLAIGMRTGDDIDEIRAILDSLHAKYTFLHTDHSHVASTHIRNNASTD